MIRSEWTNRLAIGGSAIAISAVSFGLILWAAGWLPHVLFAWWLHLRPRTRSMALPLYCLAISGVSALFVGWSQRRRRAKPEPWKTSRMRRAS